PLNARQSRRQKVALHAADLRLLVIEGPVSLLELLSQKQVIHRAAEKVGVEQETFQFFQGETVGLATEKNDQVEGLPAVITGYTGQRPHPFQVFPGGIVSGHFQSVNQGRLASVEELTQESAAGHRQALAIGEEIEVLLPTPGAGDAVPRRLEVPAS